MYYGAFTIPVTKQQVTSHYQVASNLKYKQSDTRLLTLCDGCYKSKLSWPQSLTATWCQWSWDTLRLPERAWSKAAVPSPKWQILCYCIFFRHLYFTWVFIPLTPFNLSSLHVKHKHLNFLLFTFFDTGPLLWFDAFEGNYGFSKFFHHCTSPFQHQKTWFRPT